MLVVGKEEGSGHGRCAQDFLLHRYVKEDGINRSPSALFGFVYAFPGKGFVRDTNKLSLSLASRVNELKSCSSSSPPSLLLLLRLLFFLSISQRRILVFSP